MAKVTFDNCERKTILVTCSWEGIPDERLKITNVEIWKGKYGLRDGYILFYGPQIDPLTGEEYIGQVLQLDYYDAHGKTKCRKFATTYTIVN